MKIEDVASNTLEFDFFRYFDGHTRATGWFTDRFGNVRRHFDGDFRGIHVNGVFELTEELRYTDGVVEQRQWHVRKSGDGRFTATSDSLVGEAKGVQQGNTANFRYSMYIDLKGGKRWLVRINDWFFLQQDGSVHNVSEVYKWGIKIGSVSNVFQKPLAANDRDATLDLKSNAA